jgi:FKBP-type peptidyl-prolyl cis-trans isomerase
MAQRRQFRYAGGQNFQTSSRETLMHAKTIIAALCLALGASAPTAGMAQAPAGAHLQITDTQVGTGAVAQAGHSVTVHYTGWLYENGAKGKEFDSSLTRGTPFTFALGGGQVIPGWDQGVVGMKVGGKRTLIIPPDLGYGARGAGNGVIPPGATLIFDVQLLAVN